MGQLWEPDYNADGMTGADLVALFDYFGLDLEDDVYILKRRIKELRNQKETAQNKANKLRKLNYD